MSSFSAAHVALLVQLLLLDNFEALELRSLFVPLVLDEPEVPAWRGCAEPAATDGCRPSSAAALRWA